MRPTRATSSLVALLVCVAVLSPRMAIADAWSDDFDDGDFTVDPFWYDYANGAVWQKGTVEVTGEEHYVRFKRDAGVEYTGVVYLYSSLNRVVTDESTISFDVNPVYSNISGGAGSQDNYYPIEIKLELLGSDDQDYLFLRFCYNYRGGSDLITPGYRRIAFPYCEQNVWLRDETFRIRDHFPQARFITSISLRANGWDYEGYLDNIVFRHVPAADHSNDEPFFVQGLDTLYVDLVEPENGAGYVACAPGTIRWESNYPMWNGAPEEFELYSRENMFDPWDWIGRSSNDGREEWPHQPCISGSYDVKIVHEHADELSDMVTFNVEVGGLDTLYVNITEPQNGILYSPCAPETVRWESNYPVWEGAPREFRIEWRECGGSWDWVGLSDNDGAVAWSGPPCDAGCYEVRVFHMNAPELGDTVTLDVSAVPPGPPALCLCVEFSGDAQDLSGVVHRVDPTPHTTVSAYVAASRMDGEPEDLASLSFRLSDLLSSCPGVVGTQGFTSLLPGDLSIGDPFGDTGVTIASTECFTVPYGGVAYLGRVDLLYQGGACDLQILDHSQYTRWVVDCAEPSGVKPLCVWMHGGIGKDPLDGDLDCLPNTTVRRTSWGAIKAMYR